MALNLANQQDVALKLAQALFGGVAHPHVPLVTAVAHANSADLLNAVQGVDAAFDLTLTQAVNAAGGGTTVINGLAMSVTAPAVGGWTNAEKAIIASYVLLKRAGLL